MITPQLALLATQIALATRPGQEHASELVRKCVRWGAGPRASRTGAGRQSARRLVRQSHRQARRYRCSRTAVLRHRLRLNFQAEAQGVAADDIIQEVLKSVDQSSELSASRERISKVLRS